MRLDIIFDEIKDLIISEIRFTCFNHLRWDLRLDLIRSEKWHLPLDTVYPRIPLDTAHHTPVQPTLGRRSSPRWRDRIEPHSHSCTSSGTPSRRNRLDRAYRRTFPASQSCRGRHRSRDRRSLRSGTDTLGDTPVHASHLDILQFKEFMY